MSIARIVIGLQFGDEGKGITTDYLCSQDPSFSKIVVRFSGGQQAGHNVKLNGISHIHSNYGSGTLRGVPSYFSEHCTFYPVTMYRENLLLKSKGVDPKLFIHPLAKLTTPGDVVYNRLMEKKRGHGSCGLGIGATMTRNEKTGYKLFALDLLNESILKQKFVQIEKYYYSLIESEEDKIYFKNNYNQEILAFGKALNYLDYDVKDYGAILGYDQIIFEGSQGIMLDMDHGIFPNVTYANTTSKNALDIIDKLNSGFIGTYNKIVPEIYYVTRCYQTRHGAGWMSNNKTVDLINNEDEINVFNEWQENFKIGELDYDLLKYSLDVDDCYSKNIKKNLVVTCMDQRPGFEFNEDFSRFIFGEIYYSNSSESKDIKTKMDILKERMMAKIESRLS